MGLETLASYPHSALPTNMGDVPTVIGYTNPTRQRGVLVVEGGFVPRLRPDDTWIVMGFQATALKVPSLVSCLKSKLLFIGRPC